MAPPRDTACSAPPQPHPADAVAHNQKSTTFRNGTTEEGWFYPTPAALKAGADVRGTRAARESCRKYGAAVCVQPRWSWQRYWRLRS